MPGFLALEGFGARLHGLAGAALGGIDDLWCRGFAQRQHRLGIGLHLFPNGGGFGGFALFPALLALALAFGLPALSAAQSPAASDAAPEASTKVAPIVDARAEAAPLVLVLPLTSANRIVCGRDWLMG